MKLHTVQKGDSLWKIAKMHGITLDAMIAANPQLANPDVLEVGQQVNVPLLPGVPEYEGPGTDVVPPGMGPVAEEPERPGPDMAPIGGPSYPSVPKWDGLWKYVVKQGDSMFKIAKQVGVTLDQLKAANPQVSNPDLIYPGQVLNIPSAGLKPKSNTAPMSKEQLTAPMSKEQLTAPIIQQPMVQMPMSKEQLTAPIFEQPLMPKEVLTLPKEMAPVEQPIMQPPMAQPQPQVSPIEMNIQYAPHMNYAPHEEMVQVQQVQMQQPVHHHPMIMYIPVSYKKHKCKKRKHKCCPKKRVCHCGGHKHHGHLGLMYGNVHHELMMHQHMQMMHGHGVGHPGGMMPKTFYREED
ncbi:spore coat assembly protein SafA [Tumebacillus sp. BK434]|uniref:LysM peptidoglycan-binding domain-containing protein n=1 Tax=Tumebacillus sp. BK434 TaxID=2512169 RepID=UPI001043F69D|nr:SafA/ExsA family spore coat assembly protein [Tumebacillus sp. BK434]TCP54399.1 spore coat assembly protein SafA [Tumebacillus sp. BK434]